MNSTPTPTSAPEGYAAASAPPAPPAPPAASGGTKTKIAQAARDAAGRVKSAASSAATRARDEAGRLATEKKDEAASRLGGYSAAIHESASSLEEKDPNIAWFTHRAADKLQGVADYVREADMASLRTDCEGFARRHPAAFFGGLFVAGLLLGNVVKASRRRLDSEGYSPGFDEGAEALDAPEGEGAPVELTPAERAAAGL
jgi:hypothetical protein